jgi:hypothetical protein
VVILKIRAAPDIHHYKQSGNNEIIQRKLVKRPAQCSDKGKPEAMHNVRVQIEGRDKTTHCKPHHTECNNSRGTAVLRDKKLLRHSDSVSKKPGDNSQQYEPEENQKVVFLDMQHKQAQGKEVGYSGQSFPVTVKCRTNDQLHLCAKDTTCTPSALF